MLCTSCFLVLLIISWSVQQRNPQKRQLILQKLRYCSKKIDHRRRSIVFVDFIQIVVLTETWYWNSLVAWVSFCTICSLWSGATPPLTMRGHQFVCQILNLLGNMHGRSSTMWQDGHIILFIRKMPQDGKRWCKKAVLPTSLVENRENDNQPRYSVPRNMLSSFRLLNLFIFQIWLWEWWGHTPMETL